MTEGIATPDVLPISDEAAEWLETHHKATWRYRKPVTPKMSYALKPGAFNRTMGSGSSCRSVRTALGEDADRYGYTFTDDTLHIDNRTGIASGLTLEEWLDAKHSASWTFTPPTPAKPTAIPRLSAKMRAKLEAEWAWAVHQANARRQVAA